jgi:hypothetical protein
MCSCMKDLTDAQVLEMAAVIFETHGFAGLAWAIRFCSKEFFK